MDKTAVNGFWIKIIFGLSGLMLYACSSTVVNPSSTRSTFPTPAVQNQQHLITFKINPHLIAPRFQIKQVATPAYVKLTIKNGTQTIYAQEADANGFIALNAGLQSISAGIPTASNLVATLEYCTNNNLDTSVVQTLKTAFHSPIANPVILDQSTSLKGAIIEQLHLMQSTKVNGAFNLNDLQSFTDNLTGLQTTPSLSFNRLVAPDFPPNSDYQAIDARTIAHAIDQNSLVANATSGTNLNPVTYKQTPFNHGHFPITSLNALTQPPVFGNTDQVLFHNYRGDNNNAALISIDSANLNANQEFQSHFNVTNGGPDTLRSIEGGISVGEFGQAYAMQHNTLDQTHVLRSFNLNDGSQYFSYWFFYANQAEITDFTPVIRRTNAACPCNEEDIIYTALNALSTGPGGRRGIYAVGGDFGTIDWFYNSDTEKFRGSGALSPDGNTLYVVTYSETNTAKLIALNTANGQELWVKALNASITANSSPVIGLQGDIFIATYNGAQGLLAKVSPDGSTLNTVNLNGIPEHSPVVDQNNSQDVIYISTTTGEQSWLAAINSDLSMKWTNPMQLNGTVLSSPLIGEELDQSHTLYLSTSSGQICAITDQGTTGVELWRKTPGGKPSGDFNLKDNYLYIPTADGNSTLKTTMRRLKVSTPNLPTTAPWPKRYGNIFNTGRRPMDL